MTPARPLRTARSTAPMANSAAVLPLPRSLRSTLINRNIMVGARRTSIRLEPEMWAALLDIARRESQTIHGLATLVAASKKPETSLTAAIRVFCLAYYRNAVGG